MVLRSARASPILRELILTAPALVDSESVTRPVKRENGVFLIPVASMLLYLMYSLI